MIKYLGSKRLLVPAIVEITRSLPEVSSVLDLFSGTSRVGHALKGAGFRVIANDYLSFAHLVATCYVQSDHEHWAAEATRLIAELQEIPGAPGYFTRVFCHESRFVQPENGARIDAMRGAIDAMDLEPELRAILLVSLIEAADRVDSTAGVQMAYIKKWSRRSENAVKLRVPELLPRAAHGAGAAFQMDADDAVRVLSADCAYIDPPYNQHSYLGNYHVWETLARGDAPDHYGIACKRIDCRTRKSDFNLKRKAAPAMRRIIENVDARCLIVSFNDEGFIAREEMEEILSHRGTVHTIEHDYPRYVGAKIGIHNPRGQKVGQVSHLRNTEYLYVVVPQGVSWSAPELPELLPHPMMNRQLSGQADVSRASSACAPPTV